jgi:plasmid stabilization system protein ParE
MKIIHNPTFSKALKQTLKYIAKDKPTASLNFKEELKKKIKKLPDNPYMCPPSYYFKEENVRDMTFKKYTITYEIKHQEDTIEILDIFNRNKP